jgi:uncharacterized protein (DUF58 family)
VRSRARAALLAAAGFFILMGLALRDNEVVAMALPVLFLSLILFLANRPPPLLLHVERSVAVTEYLEGDECQVTLQIRNDGPQPISVRLRERIPPSAFLEKGRVDLPLHLGPLQTAELRYSLRLPRRGRLRLGPLQVEWTDIAQSMRSEVVLRDTTTVRVLPPLTNLDRCDLLPRRVRLYSGSIRSRAVGPGGEFFALRPYEDGDEARRINWKASLRSGELYCVDLEAERSGDVVMVVDSRRRAGRNLRTADLIDREVEAASSLAAYYLREKNRVGLISIGELVEVLPAGSGQRHFHRLTDRLLNVHVGGERPSSGIRLALQRFFSHGALVIVLTPLDDQDQMAALKDLARSGYQVLVLSPGPDAAAQDIYSRLARLQRDDEILDLRRFCTVVDWTQGTDLSRHLLRGRGN